MRRSPVLVASAALAVALLVAVLAGELLGAARFGPSPRAVAVGCAIDALVAALTALVGVGARTRPIAIAVVYAVATTIVLAIGRTPWIALGPFGAGPVGELALVVVPASVLLALGAAATTRGASRTPPSSRPPSRRPRSTS